MDNLNLIRIILFLLGAVLVHSRAAGQVDGNPPKADTLYLYEEEVTYDTLYLFDTLGLSLNTKEGLVETFRQNRGVGKLYREKGGIYLTGPEETYRLDQSDLQNLFSPMEYAAWRKARGNLYASIPLYVVGAGSAAVAGIGLYQFASSFITTAKYRDQMLDSDDLALCLWRSAMGGVFYFAGGMVAATACLIPAVVFTINGNVRTNRLIENYNQSATTSLRLTMSPSPCGLGISLSF